MSTPAPALTPGFATKLSETTRLMCASVFLGHERDIRKKLKAYVTNRYHFAADNNGLDVRLLARVLDFYQRQKLRYLVWHGFLGLLCLFILSLMVLLAGNEGQQTALIFTVMVTVGLGATSYFRYMRNRYGYTLKHFTRANFNVENAMKAFANRSGKMERAVVGRETGGNVTVFSGFEPFVGSGTSIGDWSLLIDTRKGKDGASPERFTQDQLENAILSAFKTLPFPGLELGEKLFVHGTDATLIPNLLPNRFEPPKQSVGEDVIGRFRNFNSHEARVYKYVGVSSWDDQVRISAFCRASFSGPMLYVENHLRVLQPVWLGYRKVDNLLNLKILKKIGIFFLHVLLAPLFCVAEVFSIGALFHDWSEGRKQTAREKESIKEQARFNYGAVSSLRESFATAIYDHYFEKYDRNLYEKAIQKLFLDSILGFLDDRNIDTSDLSEQRTYIINSGLIVHGGLQADALAVGPESKATAKSTKKPKMKQAEKGAA